MHFKTLLKESASIERVIIINFHLILSYHQNLTEQFTEHLTNTHYPMTKMDFYQTLI